MTRDEAIARLLEHLPDDALVVASNGFVSRALHAAGDRPSFFYMIGSMGLAPAIALGVATVQPDRHVVVLDGDGNVLMNLGTLASIGAAAPRRLTHVCLDNGRHASTGGQRTLSSRVALEDVAAAAGYVASWRVDHLDDLTARFLDALTTSGPTFLRATIDPGGLAPGTPRVALSPAEMTARTQRFLDVPG